MSKLIYIADDEQNIRELIMTFLQKEGYEVQVFDSGNKLISAFNNKPSDMVILDIMMPGLDGFKVCALLRQKSNIPIIIVSARDSELDRITGITIGSDDYLTKPFSPMELTARVKALFRRLELDRKSNTPDNISYGNITINIGTRQVFCNGSTLDLSPTELAFMIYLIESGGNAVKREELLKNVWKFDFDVDTRATDDVVKRLRKKLFTAKSTVIIESVWGFGFKLGIGEKIENN